MKKEDLLLALSFYGWKKTHAEEWIKGHRKVRPCTGFTHFVYHIDKDDEQGYWCKVPYRVCELDEGIITVRNNEAEEWIINLKWKEEK